MNWLLLQNAVLNPMKAHVSGFGHLGSDCSIGNANGTFIVAQQGCWRLRVTHVAESPALSSSTAIRAAANCKNTPYFPLCNGGAHDRDTGGVGGDGVVDEAVVGDVSKVMEVAGDASGFRRP